MEHKCQNREAQIMRSELNSTITTKEAFLIKENEVKPIEMGKKV